MNDTIFKAALKGALDAMSIEELNALSDEHHIVWWEEWPQTVKESVFHLYTLSELIEYQIDNHANGWEVIITQVLDALWATHDDPSIKNKTILTWIAKQQ